MFAVAMLFCMNSTINGKDNSNREGKKKLTLTIIYKLPHPQRGIEANIKAAYDLDIDAIELMCDGTKETSVYIVDSKGEELSYDSFNSEMTSYYMVDVPQTPGTYYIIVDSPVLYAEGAFVVE